MRKFTKVLTPAVAAVLGLATIAPAVAEAAPRHEAARYTPARNADVRADINGLRAAIDRAAARRTISPREATGLRREAAEIQRLYARYARGGLDRQEARTLQNRVDRVRMALKLERRDTDRRRG